MAAFFAWIRSLFQRTPTISPVIEPPKQTIYPSPTPTQLPRQGIYYAPNGKLLINQDGLELIQHFEGLYLHAYRDSVRVVTIGWGRIKYDNGRAVKMGDTCTKEQADQWLLEDIEKDGSRYVRIGFPGLNDAQFSALASFCYNRGAGRLQELHDMTGGNVDKIPQALLTFNYAGTPHRYLLGLDRRRWAEREMFRGGDWRRFADIGFFKAFVARGYQ